MIHPVPTWPSRAAACLLAVLALAGPGAAQAPPPGLAVTTWTHDEGLPQNSINDLCSDREGYLWVATFGGLARFDGARFEVHDAGSGHGLTGSRFELLQMDRDGHLLVFGSEVGLLRLEDGVFEVLRGPTSARALALDVDGHPLLLTEAGLERIGEDGAERIVEGLFEELLVGPGGAIWLSDATGRVARHDGGELTWFGPAQGLPGNIVVTMHVDGEGHLWCSTKVGIWRADAPAPTSFEHLDWAPVRVLAMVEDEAGALWLGARTGLYRASAGRDEVERILEGVFEELLLDGAGKLWAGGSRSGGLRLLHGSPLTDLSGLHPIPPGDTWSIQPGGDDDVLVVQTRVLLTIGPDGLVQRDLEHNCRAALVDRAGTLWLGQPDGVAREVDGRSRLITEPRELRGGARAFLEGSDGTLWVGTKNGLARGTGEAFEPVPGISEVLCLLEDAARDRLWVGTQFGLARLEGDDVSWLTSADGLAAGSVRALYLEGDGDLWVGTYGGGLCRVRDDAIARVGVADGLADGFLASILEDGQGRLWLNSNRGPFAVELAELEAFLDGELGAVRSCTFSTDEAAREANGGNQNAGWRAPDGTLWLATIDGVTLVRPDLLPADEPAPRPRIEAFELSEARAATGRFTALGFTSPARLRIQHRLVGSSDAWVEAGAEREVRYSYLPPGDYALEVRARNGFGAWSPVARRSFEVPARFHESPVLFFAIVMLVGLGVYALAEVRIRKAHDRAERLQRLHDQRDEAERALARSQAALGRLTRRLLSSRAEELRTVSAELHDDVTQRLAALAMQAEVAEGRLAEADGTQGLAEITRAAQELAGDVQQLSRRLHPQGLRVLGLAEALGQEAAAFTRRTGLPVEVEVDGALSALPEAAALEAFRILQEGLHNIEKHARASHVKVHGRELERWYEVLLVDDGVGFELERGEETGLGLVTMRERAATVGGLLQIETNPGAGTTLRLRIPPGGSQP